MSIFETQLTNEEQGIHEIHRQDEIMQQSCEGDLENTLHAGTSDTQSAYQDRIARLEQRNAERQHTAEERALRQNEISFGSRAAENAANKLEERRKLERQSKQQDNKERIDKKGLEKAIKDGSRYWTQHYTNELKADAREMKKTQKKLSEL